MLYPLKFRPVYKDYLWGGRGLEKLGRTLPPGKVAESWEISAHPDGSSFIDNGELKGAAFTEVLKSYPKEILGSVKSFPLLVKLIDANDRLSVQVHPTDRYAFENEGRQYGKTEMWYVLSAKPGANIIFGTNPGVTREEFAEALRNCTGPSADAGTSNRFEKTLSRINVSAGDAVYIPAGTLHALNEGLTVAEIQQSSNLTYRVYDYSRKGNDGLQRPLHIQKALEVIDFTQGPKPLGICKGLPIRPKNKISTVTFLAAGRYFSLQLCRIKGRHLEDTNGERFIIYHVLEGAAEITVGADQSTGCSGTSVSVKQGESVLLPASPGKYTVDGDIAYLRCHVPLSREEAIGPLLKQKYALEEIYTNIGGAHEWDRI